MAGRRRDTAAGKELAGPPPGRDLRPVVASVPSGTELYRIYSPDPHGQTATGYRRFGPLARFDHHRAPRLKPDDDPERGILYAGDGFLCALAEVFGDQGSITRAGNRVARLALSRPLDLLDLRGRAAIGAGTIAAISGVGERAVTQAWSRWWYEQPALAGIDGLLYESAQCGDDCVALWERAGSDLRVDRDFGLDDDAVQDDLLLAADELGLAIDL